ncbi:hypothetical protein [Cellulosilyticum ruminicola]|uniref:hypothetical protein n=1 Tax=Cellulosilyticum ruminicola TaxID=425254 RepID=UPI001FA7FB19|nr:hypothetical protein [Cellulosilyticum ruminicola]
MDIAIILIAIALVFVILLCMFWRKVKADKAMVITGFKQRVLSGKGGIVIPFFETSCTISLEAISMTTDVAEAPSNKVYLLMLLVLLLLKYIMIPAQL